MCGIGGIYRFSNQPISPDHIKMMLCALEIRGLDAAGVALLNDDEDEIFICKKDDPGHQVAASEELRNFFEAHLSERTKIALVHCRAATKGSPRENKNNHPLYNGLSAIVHNGIISNDDITFKQLNLTREAETDSDIVRAIIDKFGLTPKAVKHLSKLSGSLAIACIDARLPKHVLLARSGSPLVLAGDDNYLFWASEKHAIHRAARSWHYRWGILMQKGKLELDWVGMPLDSAWLIGPKGLVWHNELKTAIWNGSFVTYAKGNYTTKNYKARRKRWEKQEKTESNGTGIILKRYMPCPNPECKDAKGIRRNIDITEVGNKPLWTFHCVDCRTPLAEEPVN